MNTSVALRRIFLVWSRKNRAVRALAREYGVPAGKLYEAVASIERKSLDIMRDGLEQARKDARARAANIRSQQYRPENQSTSGARLSS
jgi:hypothetical protein